MSHPHPHPHLSARARALVRRLVPAVCLLCAAAAGCAPAARGAAGAPPPLYALTVPGTDGSGVGGVGGVGGAVRAFDPTTGRILATTTLGRPSPLAMAGLADGGLVLLALAGHGNAGPTALHLPAPGAGGAVRRLALPAGSGVSLLAAAGRFAAVVYAPRGPAPLDACRVAVLDLATEAPPRTFPLCDDGETAGAALASTAGGRARLYATLTRYRPAGTDDGDGTRAGGGVGAGTSGGPAAGRIAALDLATGVLTGVRALATRPGAAAIGPAPGTTTAGAGVAGVVDQVLYVSENVSGVEDEHAGPGGWRVLGLSTPDLTPVAVLPLAGGARRLAVAPDGGSVFALDAAGQSVAEIRVDTRQERPLARLPGESIDLLVTHDRVYATNPAGTSLWAIDRRSRGVTALPFGSGSIALARPGA